MSQPGRVGYTCNASIWEAVAGEFTVSLVTPCHRDQKKKKKAPEFKKQILAQNTETVLKEGIGCDF